MGKPVHLGDRPADIKTIKAEVKAEIVDSVKFAEDSPPADDFNYEYKE